MTMTCPMLLFYQRIRLPETALSTTCFCLGLDDGMKLIESLDGIEAIFVTNEGEIHYSSGAKAYVKS